VAALERTRALCIDGVLQLLERDPERRPVDVAAARRALGIDGGQRPRRLAPVALVLVAAAGLVVLLALALSGSPAPAALTPAALPIAPRPTATPRPVSHDDAALVARPAVSPDGAFVVVASRRGGRPQLWSVALDGAHAKALPLLADAVAPQIVGDRLYFLVASATGAGFDLAVVPWRTPEAAPAIVLRGIAHADVAPDHRIAFVPHELPGTASSRIALSEAGATRVLAETPGHVVDSLRWSPDGRHVAWLERPAAEALRGNLEVVDAAGGTPQLLARDLLSAAGTTWVAPDALVAFRGEGDRRALVLVGTDGEREAVLMPTVGAAQLPAVTGDGRLVYSVEAEAHDVWLLDGGERPAEVLRRITFLGEDNATAPDWAGAALAYLVQRPGGAEVRLLEGADFGDIRARRVVPAFVSSIAISPDGRQAAYGERRGDRVLIQLAELDSANEPKTLFEVAWPEQVFPPQFRPGGERLGFVRLGAKGSRSVWDVDVAGRDPRLVLDDAGFGFVSPDGKAILFTRFAPDHTMWSYVQALDAAGLPTGKARRIDALEHAPARFGRSAREAVARLGDDLVRVDLASGKRTRLAALPAGARDVDRIVVRPDGTIACSIETGRSTLVVVDDFAALVTAARARPADGTPPSPGTSD
jgi:Tol biopolymer transport system component